MAETELLQLPIWLYPAIAVVAMLYSAVGHGGASGYIGVLSLLSFPGQSVATTALILNVIVAGISSLAFIRQKHFSWKLLWPFLLGSVPAAFIGGYWKMSAGIYSLILAVTLLLVAIRLIFIKLPETDELHLREAGKTAAAGCGAGIGLISGMVGIGGGVFLTPLLVLTRWSETKTAAGVSAVFIVVNSLSGLAGRAISAELDCGVLLPLVVPGTIGGLIGAQLGAKKLSAPVLRKVLAAVLLIASFKLVLKA